MSIKHIISGTLFAALALLFVGCEEEDKYQLRFSHALHVTEMEMACEDCHGEPGQAGFSAITHDTCLACHEEPEAEQISADTCGICHTENQVAGFVSPGAETGESMETNAVAAEPAAAAEPEQGIFVHTEALTGKCADCHGYLMGEELETVPMLKRDDMVAIRNEAHMSGQDCSMCHVGMDPAIPPASHDRAWTRRHGLCGMQADASCSVCHTEESCMDCHSVMQPVSHNNTFRLRTHGILAATDRASCQVCHQEDSCTSCHSTTRPRTHRARWASSGMRPTHCIGCHNTSSPGDGCVTCHEGGNDIALHEQYWGGASFDHSVLTTESCYICHWTKTP